MKSILKYFGDLLSNEQLSLFEKLGPLYKEWNEKINVISRKDIDNIYEHHILHSLATRFVVDFKPGTKIIDLGTGGGFPGIPLAIMYPEVDFLLVDSIGKKLKVVDDIANRLGLVNVRTEHARMEEIKEQADFVVSRAVMPLADIVKVSRKNILKEGSNTKPNGWICLKGGDLTKELEIYKSKYKIFSILNYINEDYYAEKSIVYLPLKNTKDK